MSDFGIDKVIKVILNKYDVITNKVTELDIWIRKDLGAISGNYYLTEEIFLHLHVFDRPSWFILDNAHWMVLDKQLSFQEVFNRVTPDVQQKLLYHLDLLNV